MYGPSTTFVALPELHLGPRGSARTAMSPPSGATKKSSWPLRAQTGRVPPAVEIGHGPALTFGKRPDDDLELSVAIQFFIRQPAPIR